MSTCRIKKGDMVIANSGYSAGKIGKVLKIDTKKERAIVEGLNMVKKTVRKSQQNPEGNILEIPAPIHLSNLMPYDPKAKKGVRISYVREDGKAVRVAKGTGHRFE